MSSTLPWTIKIETTEGCNRECVFCPVPLIYGKTYNFLTLAVAARIVDQLLEWQPHREWRFELAMLGEPTLNRELPAIIREIRRIGHAQITVFSNGDVMRRKPDLMTQLFESGVNILAIDCYDKETLDHYENSYIGFFNFHRDKYPLYAKKKLGWMLRDLVLINDLATTQDLGSVRKMHNYGGNVDNSRFGVPEVHVKAGCEKPFRDLVISHKGDVLLCCLDANKDAKMGNIYETDLRSIWYGEGMNAVRRQLVRRERLEKPCLNCNWFGGSKRFIAEKYFHEILNS